MYESSTRWMNLFGWQMNEAEVIMALMTIPRLAYFVNDNCLTFDIRSITT